MYDNHFNLNGRPFRTAPCVDDYVPTSVMQRAIEQCVNALHRELGLAYVIGGPGTGKTLALDMIAERMKQTLRSIHVFCNRDDSRSDLLQNICFELGQPYRNMSIAELRLTLKSAFCRRSESAEGTLLLLDDAERLSIDVMDELCWISNLTHAGSPLVSIVLAGSISLEETLNHPRLASLNQRIAARTYLSELNRDETRKYICGQLQRVGGTPAELISDGAIDRVHQYSQGCPRVINQICDQAMLLVASHQGRRIDERAVQQAWADIQCVPVVETVESAYDPTPRSPDGAENAISPPAIEVNSESDADRSHGQPTPSTGAVQPSSGDCDVVEFGTLDDQPAGVTHSPAVSNVPDDAFELSEPTQNLAPEPVAAERSTSSAPLVAGPKTGADGWSVVTPVHGSDSELSEEYRLAPLEDEQAPPAGSPFDESFDVEESIENQFCTVVAEQNLNALRVNDQHVHSLNAHLQARINTGLAATPDSTLPKVVYDETRTKSVDSAMPHDGAQPIQFADYTSTESSDAAAQEIRASDYDDLRLTPEEIAQLESVDQFLSDVEARFRQELNVHPETSLEQQPIKVNTTLNATAPSTGAEHDVTSKLGPPTATPIPTETRLDRGSSTADAVDDRDLLIVSHVHRQPAINKPLAGTPAESAAGGRGNIESADGAPQGSAVRMDYQQLFRQLKQSSTTP